MVLFSEFVRAEEQSPFNEIARERLYVGGLDESDLRVQQVHTAGIKNKPTDTQESNEGF